MLCDRFADASYAYQGGGRGQPLARVAGLERWACDGVTPDLTLLLDLPVATGRARAAGRGEADRIEVEADAFFERVRAVYRERARAEPGRFRMLDASQSPASVLQAATDAVAACWQVQGDERFALARGALDPTAGAPSTRCAAACAVAFRCGRLGQAGVCAAIHAGPACAARPTRASHAGIAAVVCW